MKRTLYLLLAVVVISLGFSLSIKADVSDTSDMAMGEEVEETTEFDYSKMEKKYRYKSEWSDYYDISFCSNITIKNQTYTGKEIKPAVKILVHNPSTSMVDTKLDKKYYRVTWKNNVKPGKATAVIEGINGFKGKATVKFKIKMPKVKIKKVSSKGKKIIVKVVKFKSKNIKYQVRYKRNTGKIILDGKNYKTTGKWKKTASQKNTIKTKKLKKGNYFLQVRSYTKIKGKKYYGNWQAYGALVNVGTKKANKNNFKFGSYRCPNKFAKLKKSKKYVNFGWLHTKSKVNGIQKCFWGASFNEKNIYSVWADKHGNIIANRN